tara:strand:+ start:381 stop:722 length:342 start_codon:yes stop_codon:yes gene_type:complete
MYSRRHHQGARLMQFTIPPVRLEVADLWSAGVNLEWWQLSELLSDCTGWTIKRDRCPDDPDEIGHWLIDPCGDPYGEIWPGPDTDDLECFVADRIYEALADCGLFSTDSPDDF